MFKHLLHASALATLLIVCGCSSTPVTEDNTNPILEPALNDPSGLNSSAGDGFSALGSGAGQGQWVSPNQLAGNADADGWIPVDPQNRLNMPIIYFAYDSDVLVPSETANLDKIAAYMKQRPALGLVIEGHCDSRGTDEYNRALGERRAIAVENKMRESNVDLASIRTVSYGEDKPAVTGNNESAWSQNRRAVLWVGKIK